MFSVTLVATLFVKRDIDEDAARDFTAASEQIVVKMQERLSAYALILRGAAALFDASNNVTRANWRAYVETLRARDAVPGVQGIGYAALLRPEQVASTVAAIRAEGFPDFDLKPAGKRDVYSCITLLEPLRDRNLRAFGYDMLSEPTRREALERARDRGEATLTGKVVLLQETETDVQPGTLMYVPVYRKGMPKDTIEQRRAAIMGWTYSPYRMRDLMQGILGALESGENGRLQLAIYDGHEPVETALLYRTDASGDNAGKKPVVARIMEFHGRPWLLHFTHSGAVFGKSYVAVLGTAGVGLLITVLLWLLLRTLGDTFRRAEKIAERLTHEISHNRQLLAESEFRWRFALEGAGDGLWDWNIPSASVYYSDRWKQILGYAPEEVGGSSDAWSASLHPADKDEVMSTLQQHLDGKTPVYSCEYRARCKNGEYKWILDRGVVVSRDPEGHPLRMIGSQSDITARKQLEENLRTNQAELEEAQRIGMIGSWRMDVATKDVTWSPQLYRMFSMEPEEGAPSYDVQSKIFSPESWDLLSAAVAKTSQTGEPYELDLEIIRKDGSHGYMLARGEAIFDIDGKVTGLHGVAADITERKQAEERLRLAASVFTNTREGILITDREGKIIEVNDAFTHITGYSREESIGQNPSLLKSGLHDVEFYAALWKSLKGKGYWSGEIHNRKKSGEIYTELLTITSVKDDSPEPLRYVGLFSDITLLKEHQRHLEHIAHYDALTGLPNRVLLADRMHQAMVQAERRGQQLAVAYIDLDGFKVVNDSYGHDAGDQLLMAVSNHMKHSLREGDTLARLGGDEFVAVLLDLPDLETAGLVLGRFLQSINQPTIVNNTQVQVSASIGVTFYPQESEIDADQLLRQADQAMYQAKLSGRNRYQVFDRQQDSSMRSKHESIEQIRGGFTRREFVLYYQPKVNMRTGAIVGLEALIRWQHPEKGILSPAAFIPVVEDHPLAVEISEWVVEMTLDHIGQLQAHGFNIQTSCNLTAQHIRKPGFLEFLRAVLARHPQSDANLLQFEILETSALGDLDHISRLIEECRSLGVAFALDDFGTGYSSLTYLRRLAADFLKIDQTFIRDMTDDPEALAIIDGILGLASAFRRQVIAEGVETETHGRMLLQLGCEQGQGYAIARPMPFEKLPEWLRSWRPFASWQNTVQLPVEVLQLLYARSEHSGWLRGIESHIQSGNPNVPRLEENKCRFAIWLATDAAQKLSMDQREELIDLHKRLHQLGQEIAPLAAEGSAPQAKVMLSNMKKTFELLSGRVRQVLGY